MEGPPITKAAAETEWFAEWFGEEYLQLYPHRDEAEARKVVALIRCTVPWRNGWRVLDVACGAGRHARALDGAGARTVGVDLSARLLRRARELTAAPLVRADMRWLPVRPRSMDLTVNLFTSFGYFDDDAVHASVLREMVGTVRPEGWFVLDFLHADTVRASLVERDTAVGGQGVHIVRHLSADGQQVWKTITLADGRQFVERVRLFAPDELERMLAAAGVQVEHRFGDYEGGPLVPGAPRVLLMGRVA